MGIQARWTRFRIQNAGSQRDVRAHTRQYLGRKLLTSAAAAATGPADDGARFRRALDRVCAKGEALAEGLPRSADRKRVRSALTEFLADQIHGDADFSTGWGIGVDTYPLFLHEPENRILRKACRIARTGLHRVLDPPAFPDEREAESLAADAAALGSSCRGSGGASSDVRSRLQRYELTGPLDRCYDSRVERARDTQTGEQVVIKMKRRPRKPRHVMRCRLEARIVQSLDHDNVIRVRETFESPDTLYLVLPFLPGGDLADRLGKTGPLTEQEARSVFCQVVAALEHCHRRGVVHRDVKPANIAFDGDRAMLIDFGWSLPTGCRDPYAKDSGTTGYAAPEQRAGQEVEPSDDMFGLGVTLAEALGGRVEVYPDRAPEVLVPEGLSWLCRDLLHKLLRAPRREDRPTAAQVRTHPWFHEDVLQG